MINLTDYFHSVTMDSFGGSREESCKLYCMDGRIPGNDKPIPKLNKKVGFSSFSCCDFFQFKNGVIFLIEATQALDTEENITNKCPHIPWNKFIPENNFSTQDIRSIKTDVFLDHMAKKSLLKVLGSMAMLSRVAVKCNEPEFQKLHMDNLPKYEFYLVIHLPPPEGRGNKNARALDGLGKTLEKTLKNTLRQALDVSKELILEVDVIIGSQLAQKMHNAGFA